MILIFFCLWTAITAPLRFVDHLVHWAVGASESTPGEYLNLTIKIYSDDFEVSATNFCWTMVGIAMYGAIALIFLAVKAKSVSQAEGHRLINSPLDEI